MQERLLGGRKIYAALQKVMLCSRIFDWSILRTFPPGEGKTAE